MVRVEQLQGHVNFYNDDGDVIVDDDGGGDEVIFNEVHKY